MVEAKCLVVVRRGSALLAASALGLSLASFAGRALAQDAAAPQPAASAAGAADSGEIVVTALRRDMALIDAPAAISSIDASTLHDQQITDLSDLGQKVPGLVFSEQVGVSQVSVRGVALTSTVGALEAPVAMHYDGAYLPAATPLEFLFLDIGNAEILRGPQGTLYGRNATGGAINFIPQKPRGQFGGLVDISYANYDTYRIEGAVTGPLIPDLLNFRLAGVGAGRSKGFVRNLENGERLGEYRERGVRGALSFTPAETFSVDLSGIYFKRRQNVTELSFPRIPIGQRAIDDNKAILGDAEVYEDAELSFDPRRVRYNSAGEAVQENKGAIATAKWSPSESLTLTSKTSYFNLENDLVGSDCDATQVETCTGTSLDDSKVFQQEFNLSGDVGDRLNYVLGAYYGRERQNWVRDYVFANSQQGLVVVSGSPFPNGTATVNHRSQLTKSYALYADLTYELSDQLDLFGGVRWAKDRRSADFESLFSIPVPDADPFVVGVCNDFTATTASASDSWNKMSFKAGAKYDLDRGNIYAQFQQGFKAGGFNPASCGQTFKQETVNAYEIGYKTDLPDLGLSLRLAAFHYDYSNMQVYVILPTEFVLPVITNAKSAVVDGIEAELAWEPTERLRLDTNVGWIPRAKYNAQFLNTDPFTDAIVDLNGNRVPQSPKLTLGAGAQYTFPVGAGGDLTLRGEIYYNSGMNFTAFADPNTAENGYVLGNLFASYKPADGNWSLRLFARNITDTKYLVGSTDSNIMFNTIGSTSQPRAYGIGFNLEI